MKLKYLLTLALLTTLSACNEHDYELSSTLLPMEFGTEYPMRSRATDAGFADGDRMGIFVYDYKNMAFTFDESNDKWNGTNTIYWKDTTTPVDVIGYYPYSSSMTDAANYSFSISTRQDKCGQNGEPGGYEASDLLWAKAENVQPGSGRIILNFNHIMAGITIVLEKGDGFTDAEWTEAKKQAYVCNAITSATVNLEEGTVSVSESAATARITPTEYNDSYRAVLVPQTYKQGEQILGIDVNGQNYALTKSELTQFASGKMHKYTLKIDKRADTGDYTFSLVGERISQWIDDEDFHDGIVRQYITVNVENPGTFAQTLAKMGLNYTKAHNIKVIGYANDDDIMFMGDMPELFYLNLQDLDINSKTIPESAFEDSSVMRILLPKNLTRICGNAFFGAHLTGTLILPEGLEEIEYSAFGSTWNVNTKIKSVSFPSTLKKIGDGAFSYRGIEGNLMLPDDLTYIGDGAFGGCNFSGTLKLPSKIEHLGGISGNFTGDLIIPSNIKEISDGAFHGCTFDGSLVLPEGLTKIGSNAFIYCGFKGELVLPSTVKEIGVWAFAYNDFSNVVFPKELRKIHGYAFEENQRLSGEIVIPDKILEIPEYCFWGCSSITGVRLPKNLVRIGAGAFSMTYALHTIICENPQPPIVDGDSFEDMSKSQINVEVPKEGLTAYKSNKYWREFPRITEYRNFVCRPATACALNKTHRQTLVLNADADWRVVHQPDWVKLSKTSGSLKTSIDITFSELGKGATMRTDSIVFQLEGTDVQTYCKLSQYDYQYAEDEVVTLQKHKKGNGIGIYFVGDGWDGEAISSGEYLDLCKQDMEYFFGLPPYDRLRDYFDVYAIIALSQENGINTINTYRDTKFNTIYSIGGGIIPEDDIVFPYLTFLTGLKEGNKEPGRIMQFSGDFWKHLIVLIPNTKEYSGRTFYYNDGSCIVICPPSDRAYPNDTRGTIQHEAGGHGFGKLGDELITTNGYAPDYVRRDIDEKHWYGWYQNLATTGTTANVPWADLIYNPRYSNYVDVFEGGMGYTRWIWRSEANSCMNYGIPYYNAISRLDITRRVFNLAGVPFDINRDFYDVDTDEWGSTGASRSAARPIEGLAPFRNPQPVFMDNNMRKKIKELRKKQKRQ